MKLTVSCKICGKIISQVEKDNIAQQELDEYQNNSSCEEDGPFQQFDENGDPIEKDTSSIAVVKTVN